jgi:hypothetical protein
MDTIFHVAQPHGRMLDLSLTDQEILNNTFNAIKDDPTFGYMEDWQTRIKEKLNDNSN